MIRLKDITSGPMMTQIQALYERAFPASEKKPFSFILSAQKEGVSDIFAICEEERFLGLAITAKAKDKVLLDYLAVDESKRGSGAGSGALSALGRYYEGKRIIIEIESTEKVCKKELEVRQRRKHFYLKNGFSLLPYVVDLWGVEMEMLSNGRECSFEEYLDIYLSAFGNKISPQKLRDKIRFLHFTD